MAFVPVVGTGRRQNVRKTVVTRMGVDIPFRQFRQNLESLPSVDDVKRIELFAMGPMGVRRADLDGLIQNIDGQRASLQIYNALLKSNAGLLNREVAKEGLELFAEITQEAEEKPGSHPNVDRLRNVVEEKITFVGKVDGEFLA